LEVGAEKLPAVFETCTETVCTGRQGSAPLWEHVEKLAPPRQTADIGPRW
jgi:hypothetical protein